MNRVSLFPQLPFTAPDWGINSSLVPKSIDFNNSIVLPLRQIAVRLLTENASVKNVQYERFINHHLLTPLFVLMDSDFIPNDFSRLRNLGSDLPNSSADEVPWKEMVDKISQRLNEPVLEPYTKFDKFRLTISLLNDMWFSKKDLYVYRKINQGRDALSHFNNLEVAGVLGELHYAPLGRPLNAYFLNGIPAQSSEYIARFDTTGSIASNLDMLNFQAVGVIEVANSLPGDSELVMRGLSPYIYKAGNHAAGKLIETHNPSALFSLSVEDAFARTISGAAHHTQEEIALNSQIVTLDPQFYARFAEKRLKEGGLLYEIYKAQKADPQKRPLDPILDYAIFQLACSFKKGEISRDYNVMLYQWISNVCPLSSSPAFNREQFFYSKFAIQLLADELGITQNSLDISNYGKYKYEDLANQAIALADKPPHEISAALTRVYTREFETEIDASIFHLY
jgi:hypothetical protein